MVCVAAYAEVALTPAGDGHLVVPAYINGKGPFPFILDTGADGTGIYHWFALQEKMKPGRPELLVGQIGSTDTATYRIKSLMIDGHTLRNGLADDLPNRVDAGKEVGVAGNDFMDGKIVTYDFPCKVVQVASKPLDLRAIVGSDAPPVQAGIVKDGTQLTLPVTINGVEGMALLDTGSRDTRINYSFARAAGIDTNSAKFYDADVLHGTNSKGVSSRKGPIGIVRFAGLEVKDPEARVVDLASFRQLGYGDRPAMILGQDLMLDYRLIYDHEERRFWFQPSKCVPKNK